MKRIIFIFAVVWFAFVPSLQAQVVLPVLAGGEDSLSYVFSKEFTLDTPFVMNSFEYIMKVSVSEDGLLAWEDGNISSSYTVCLPNSTEPLKANSVIMDNYYTRLQSEIKEYLIAKIDKHEITVIPGKVSGVPADMIMDISLIYSPVYYARTGDTLHCDRTIANQAMAYGEKDVMCYRFDIRNNCSTPYYAVVRRHKNDVTLFYYDTLTNEPFLIEKYMAPEPRTLLRTGYATYLEGNKVHHRQYYETDTLRYVETFDSINKLYAKYQLKHIPFTASLRVQQKDVYYPSGKLQMHIEYPDQKMLQAHDYQPRVLAYKEDGTEAKFKYSPNIKSVIMKWFRKNFRIPKIPEKTSEINYIVPQPVLIFHVDADGKMEYRGKAVSSTEWTYNYHTGFSKDVIDRYIREYYAPYLETVLHQLEGQTLYCKPSTLDKQPVESLIIVPLEIDFMPR